MPKLFDTAVYADKATLVAADLLPVGDSAASTGGVFNNKTATMANLAAFVAANGVTLAGVAGVLTATAPAAGAGVGWTITASAAASGATDGGSITVVPGLKSGAGADGKFIVRQPGGVAGTDEVWLYDDGSVSWIETKQADLRIRVPDYISGRNLTFSTGDGGNPAIGVTAGSLFLKSDTTASGSSVLFSNSSGGIAIGSNFDISFTSGAAAATRDARLFRDGAASIQMGANVNGAAINQMFKAHDGITGTDINAANLTIAGGRGTGAGTGGQVLLATPTTLGTGTTAQTLVTRVTISKGAVTTDAVTITLADKVDLVLNGTTGTKIGTATSQKLSLWNATPIIQPASANQAILALDVDVTGADTVDLAAVNANFAAIQVLVNELRANLIAVGVIKGAA